MNRIPPLPAIFILFLLLHLFLFNINSAEWGDSYRILRAAEFAREWTYPEDEKRPPLFSLILATRPQGIEAVVWGRIIMLSISIGAFLLYNNLLTLIFKKEVIYRYIALVFFALNPVYLYWSLRIMADVPLSLFALAIFNLLILYKSSRRTAYVLLLGFLAGLSVLMRFEGYVLILATLFGIIFREPIKMRYEYFRSSLSESFKHLFLFFIPVLLLLVPYWYYRNPFNSTYLEEPSGRAYDLSSVIIFLLSLMFALGFIPTLFHIVSGKKHIFKFLASNVGITTFLLVELVLILAWPAAIPRLFVAVVPILIILLVLGLKSFFESETQVPKATYLLVNLALLCSYIIGQYYYKLQFLVLFKLIFLIIIALTLIQILVIWRKNIKLFMLTSFSAMLIWSLATIWLHKDIFKVIKEANVYVVSNLAGKVGYNDVSSVSNWYLNDSGTNSKVSGVYYDLTKKDAATSERLTEKNLDYILVTNEHNTDLEIDISKKPHLIELTMFKQEINGKVFFTKVIKFDKNYEQD